MTMKLPRRFTEKESLYRQAQENLFRFWPWLRTIRHVCCPTKGNRPVQLKDKE